ncbi:DUF6491 family protein [Luteimonas pelagia]
MSRTIPITVAILFAVSGCATTGDEARDAARDARLELHRAHAGAPVSTIPFSRSIDNWTYLGDRNLVVWTSPARAYLLELGSRCDELEYAHSIVFDGSGPNISAGFDSVRVVSPSAPLQIPCRIQVIRPLDVPAIRAAERGEG